ncbi:hypothetical protein TNCV_2412931 [Trichonephila clavipes]|nr:hypothetical protein TNCV_2412931 [Trichonephila clavipes]
MLYYIECVPAHWTKLQGERVISEGSYLNSNPWSEMSWESSMTCTRNEETQNLKYLWVKDITYAEVEDIKCHKIRPEFPPLQTKHALQSHAMDR